MGHIVLRTVAGLLIICVATLFDVFYGFRNVPCDKYGNIPDFFNMNRRPITNATSINSLPSDLVNVGSWLRHRPRLLRWVPLRMGATRRSSKLVFMLLKLLLLAESSGKSTN